MPCCRFRVRCDGDQAQRRHVHASCIAQLTAKMLRPFCAGSHSGARPLRATLARPRARTAAVSDAATWSTLEQALDEVKRAPPSMKQEASSEVLTAMRGLSDAGTVPKWGSALDGTLSRRSVQLGELRQVGVKEPDQIATPSVRNDMAFLVTVVGVSSVLAVAASFLPGDWGFFTSYLTGGISIAVLAIGSTNPGILAFFIDKFSQVFPDYRDRVLRHEAAHFLLGYLLGVPVVNYDLSIGREHTDFAEAKLQKRLFQSSLEDSDVDALAVMAMAGVAAEASTFPEVMGQTADLFDLQKILNKSANKLSNAQQQNVTRWAVWQACIFLRRYSAEYDALREQMASGAGVADCIRAIEETPTKA